ncbi:uncharacterized protein LOC110737090 [Chenopodium quinoa]|uniref:uncharacterized protein LOC110737090 n=1 Tax=Chenopodium quinoa TaxID=63459 RepID=UPI000B779DAE|nr:uncharacterized protein LOC110737090 [Chenopodium quinoa]
MVLGVAFGFFWKGSVDLLVFTSEAHTIHALFHFRNDKPDVLISGMHAPSIPNARHALWRKMRESIPPDQVPWLFLEDAGLVDLGFHGNPFTWTNAREGIELIQQRLDRAMGNLSWVNAFPHTKVNDDLILKDMASEFFKDKISSKLNDNIVKISFNPYFRISSSEASRISKIPSIEEIKEVLFRMDPMKCPGPDDKLKPFLNKLINPLQSSFIKGRGIEDNVIVIKEIAHIFNKAKKGKNITALKLDLSKVYDSLEWSFIENTLIAFNFPSSIITLIMSCISTPRISVLWNGEITKEFVPSRGIRQGDPMSSYIFVLCLERLSNMIEASVNEKRWKSIKISKNISISHIFYADDVFLFCHASSNNIKEMMDILNRFGDLSGLRINLAKSSLICSPAPR